MRFFLVDATGLNSCDSGEGRGRKVSFPLNRSISTLKYNHGDRFLQWQHLLDKATQCICAEVVGNYLYVAAKELVSASKKMSHSKATLPAFGRAFVIYRYDPVSNVWETLPRFQGSDISVGCLCSVNEHIYVFSDSDAPQRYNSAQKDWQSGSELPFLKKKDDEEKLVFVKAVSMKSKIYVLHGFYREHHKNDHAYEAKPAVVHCFDPQKNVWKKKASTIHPHFESTLIVDGKVYFILNKFPFDSGIRIPDGNVSKPLVVTLSCAIYR